MKTVKTEFGDVRIKRSKGFGIEKAKLEYDDLARIARESGKTIAGIRMEIEKKM